MGMLCISGLSTGLVSWCFESYIRAELLRIGRNEIRAALFENIKQPLCRLTAKYTHIEVRLTTKCTHPEVWLTTKCTHPEVKLTTKWTHPEVRLTTKCTHPEVRLTTKCTHPEVRLTTKCKHHEVRLTTKCTQPEVRLTTKCTYPEVRLTTKCTYPEVRLTTKCTYPEVRLTTKCTHPEVRLTTKCTHPEVQLPTKCTHPEVRLTTKCTHLEVRLTTKCTHPEVQLTTKYTHPQVGAHDGGEDLGHGLLAEGVHGDDVEVSQEARGDRVTTATRGPHGAQELDVLKENSAGVLQVIPVLREQQTKELNSHLLVAALFMCIFSLFFKLCEHVLWIFFFAPHCHCPHYFTCYQRPVRKFFMPFHSRLISMSHCGLILA